MPIVALAFHEQIAMEKLNQYFIVAETAGGESCATNCPKCSLAFAVVLINRENKSNPQYIENLRALIAEDCINGIHRDEYSLTVASLPGE